MLIKSIEKKAEEELKALVEAENSGASGGWSVVAVSRSLLRKISNTEFLLAIKSVMQECLQATIYFATHSIYIAWVGMRRHISKKLQKDVGDLMEEPEKAAEHVKYIDPAVDGNELIIRLQSEIAETIKAETAALAEANKAEALAEAPPQPILDVDPRRCRDLAERKRQHLNINLLVVDDQPFLRMLLFEVLKEKYTIHMASTLKDGLALYVKEAPHIVLLDIGLPDGSGHLLAEKLHEIDPTSYIVMITGSREVEDVTTAKKNGVHGFILKPFSKAKILEIVQSYAAHHSHLIGNKHP